MYSYRPDRQKSYRPDRQKIRIFKNKKSPAPGGTKKSAFLKTIQNRTRAAQSRWIYQTTRYTRPAKKRHQKPTRKPETYNTDNTPNTARRTNANRKNSLQIIYLILDKYINIWYIIINERQTTNNTPNRKGANIMKHTKSMVYNETTESRELFLYATNDGNLYRQMITPIINNMRKKAQKGIYNSDKAVDAWYPVATAASNKYGKDYGYTFSVQDRYTAAVDMEEYYREEIFYSL